MQSTRIGSCAAPTTTLSDLDLLFAFEDLAQSRDWPVQRNVEDTGYADPNTHARWEGFEAAHGPHGRRPVGQQLYAEIKKSSKYAHQAEWCRNQGYGYPFKVRIREASDGYVVKGGVGGQYSLADVNLYVLEGGKKIRVK